MSDWPFGDLHPHSYGLILADPPWRFETFSERGNAKGVPYQTMTKSELMRLPVHKLAAPNCALVMWFTPEQIAFAVDLVKRWGFEPKTMGFWGKLTRTGNARHFGKGHWWREAGEPYLAGSIGRPKICSHSERNYIEAPIRESSRKPDELHEQLERMFPRVRKLELFSRCQRPGWDHWGNQVDFFAPEESA
ncbi:MAG TPA: MT-A70 family methyltransferase [Methylocystis sp.]|jgi:N6-adenosine-specific RNA methylase IME4